jgi:hypothetical protein
MCFFISAEKAYLEGQYPIYPLETLSSRNNSFQKLSKFSQGINMLGVAHSNIAGFLWTDTCASSDEKNTPKRKKKESLCEPWKTYVAGGISFKNYLNSHRESMS